MEKLINKTAYLLPALLARASVGDVTAITQLAILGFIGAGIMVSNLAKKE